jgi:hypothetical protein
VTAHLNDITPLACLLYAIQLDVSFQIEWASKRKEESLLHTAILVEIASKISNSMGETPGTPVKLEQDVENLFCKVARRHLWSIRLLDGWYALCKLYT